MVSEKATHETKLLVEISWKIAISVIHVFHVLLGWDKCELYAIIIYI